MKRSRSFVSKTDSHPPTTRGQASGIETSPSTCGSAAMSPNPIGYSITSWSFNSCCGDSLKSSQMKDTVDMFAAETSEANNSAEIRS
mmetsp:Transcript_3078/g.4984  ORF Transcript_3078/g.4984 Transcript_3078/m.4984 type:complete len:87 (-) Transcript_3078:74-334(-)